MNFLLVPLYLTILVTCTSGQHRSPPGVNPQQYQQGAGGNHPPPPPPPPQGGHQPQQFVQQPQKFQQQHPQQFSQQPPQQQQFQQHPPQQQHQQFQQQHQPVQQVQHGQQGQQRVLHKNVNNEREHMKEHMEVPIDTSNMSEQELQFHYFKMHDSDGNNKLDGCELVKSLIHWHDSSNHDAESGHAIPEEKIFKDEELVNMIDPILASDDKNKDGFIDYSEFILAQQAAQAKAQD